MIRNRLITYLFGISICLVDNAVALEGIVNGAKAGVDQFPYQVALMYNGEIFCGGGIIGEKFIITAAHCVMKKDGNFVDNRMTILAGTNDFERTDPPALNVGMHTIYVPKEYISNSTLKVADIAVIKLRHSLPLSKHIDKLELPKHQYETFYGCSAVIAGFGWQWARGNGSDRVGGRNDTQLRFAETRIHSFFPKEGRAITVPEILIHAQVKQPISHKPSGVCLGDSGSPLVHHKTVIGVLNRSTGTCIENETGSLYASVSHYMDFIHDAMHEENLEDMHVHRVHH